MQMHTGAGQALWRTLGAPKTLQISSFVDNNPRRFGLIQRSREFDDYQDAEALYHLRPSAWIEPEGNWGEGEVRLVEIPVENEFNDNIVSYWVPKEPLARDKRHEFHYRLGFAPLPANDLPLAKVRQHGLDNPAFLRFICQQLSEKLFVSSRLHSNVALKAIYKIAKYLTYRCQTDGAIIQLEKREAIAAMLGVSVRQLNRALKELAEQGLIAFKNKTVEVLDEPGLADIGPSDA